MECRILVCGQCSSKTVPQSIQCAEAFVKIGFEVRTVDTEVSRVKPIETLKRWSKSIAKLFGYKEALSKWYSRHERELCMGRVRYAFQQFQPQLVLVIRGNRIDLSLIKEMRDAGAKVVGWWIEGPARAEKMYSEVSAFDGYYCIHRNLCRDDVSYMPAWSVDVQRYYPAVERDYAVDVAFVGAWAPKRQAYLEALADLDLGIVGPGWRTRNLLKNPVLVPHVVKGKMYGDELVRFYQSARIVVNINGWAADEGSGTNLRIVDVPACGAFLLTEYSQGIEEVYLPGHEVAVFSSPAELRSQVEHYLADTEDRERIAAAGLARTRTLHTPEDRVKRILTDVFGTASNHAL